MFISMAEHLFKYPNELLLVMTVTFFFIGVTMELTFRNESRRFKNIARLVFTIFLASTPFYVSSPLLQFRGFDYHRFLFTTFAVYSWICLCVGWGSAHICHRLRAFWYCARLKTANIRLENQDVQPQTSL